jgi:hypothetical protein
MPYKNKTPEQIRKKLEESTIGESRTELVRSPQAISPFTEGVQAMIARLVKDRVDQIVIQNKADEPEPDFLPREIDYQVRRAQDVFERHKWPLYFEKWGCRMCRRKKNVSHAAGGCCSRCYHIVTTRLRQIRLAYEQGNPEYEIFRQIDRLTLPERTAKQLLAERRSRQHGKE